MAHWPRLFSATAAGALVILSTIAGSMMTVVGITFSMTLFVVHNEDAVRHGFISPLFVGRFVQGEGEGIEAFGTGIEGFHLDPGKTLAICLTPDRQGKITFRCDLHPEVQGELYLLDVPVG